MDSVTPAFFSTVVPDFLCLMDKLVIKSRRIVTKCSSPSHCTMNLLLSVVNVKREIRKVLCPGPIEVHFLTFEATPVYRWLWHA